MQVHSIVDVYIITVIIEMCYLKLFFKKLGHHKNDR